MTNLTAYLLIAVILWLGLVVQTDLNTAGATARLDNRVRQIDASSVENYLDKEIVKMIASAKRINVYHLKSFATELDKKLKKKKYFAEYEVLGVKKANKKRTSELKSALLESANYVTDETNKCTFTATIGLKVISKSGRLDVVISYRCDKLLFLRGNTETYKEVKSLERFHRLANELFKGPLN